MSTWTAPFRDVGVDTNAYTAGDALGVFMIFTAIPEHGVIHAIQVIDRDKEDVNLDVVMFNAAIAGSAANAAFAPTDAELSTLVGSVLISTWKDFSTNSMGIATAIGLPYWAPSNRLWIQCVTRGTPTYTAATDVLLSLSIVV